MGSRPLAVAFCHPDLGLGGAERLVVDAACELAAAGHSVCTLQACLGSPACSHPASHRTYLLCCV
jgi:hypothetical protein